MYNPFSLQGKTILVTGASSGIGKATAIECSKMGATLIITGRNEERLNETFKILEGAGHQQFFGDMTDENFRFSLMQKTPILYGIVNAVGITMLLPFKYTTEEKLDHLFDVNFRSNTLLMLGLVKDKKIQKGGSVVFISSVSGTTRSHSGGSIYSATKGAINGLVKGLALELSTQQIRVNTVVPAMIHTNILHEIPPTQDEIDEDVKHYPLKRYGNPEDVAFAIIYLLSEASAWVTGTNLLIDGGLDLK